MFVHFKVESETVRVFIDGDENSYNNRESYDSIASIKYEGDDVAYVYAALGRFPAKARRMIVEYCKSKGVKEIRWEHKNKNREFKV